MGNLVALVATKGAQAIGGDVGVKFSEQGWKPLGYTRVGQIIKNLP